MLQKLLANFNNEAEFNYSVHVSPEGRFIYFNNPKCACTTIKATLNIACGLAVGRQILYRNIAEIHDRRRNLLLTPAQVGYPNFLQMLKSSEVFKFAAIREPLHRLASAYASKMTWPSDIHNKLVKDELIANDQPVSFSDFLSLLSSSELIRDCDEHWRLQRKQICYDLIDFDRVILFEKLQEALPSVLEILFQIGDHPVFDVREHFAGNATGSGGWVAQLGDSERGLVGEVYSADYKMYDQVLTRVDASPV